jgi:hypothetical protein
MISKYVLKSEASFENTCGFLNRFRKSRPGHNEHGDAPQLAAINL